MYARKTQKLLANKFEDSRIIFDFLKPPRRNSRFLTLPSISTQIEAEESTKEDGLSSERIEKEDNDVHCALESQIEEEEDELRLPLAVKKKQVS